VLVVVHGAPFAMQFRIGVAVVVAGTGVVEMVVPVIVAGVAVLVAVDVGMDVAVLVGMAVAGAVRVGVLMAVDVAMLVVVFVGVGVAVIVGMIVIVTLDPGFTLAAAADGTHKQTPENKAPSPRRRPGSSPTNPGFRPAPE
jgi:hypothetical protein